MNRMKSLLAALAIVAMSSPILAQSDPIVIETPERYRVNYEIRNPNPSTIDHIVGMVIEVDTNQLPGYWPGTSGTGAAWQSQRVHSGNWGSAMEQEGNSPYDVFPLTWQEFYGGIAYPFAAQQDAVGYFARYNQSATDTFELDTPGDAISPGQSLAGLYVDAQPMSTYRLAYMSNPSGTFSSNGLPSIEGEAIPEPATLALLALGGTGLLARRRRK